MNNSTKLEMATFGGGCFWCVKAIFKELRGVEKVVSGYAGGKIANPTYERVSSGTTGHAEAVQISFDPKVISYEQLLEVFFLTHDPTTANRQGDDIGAQYRSVIFYPVRASSNGIYHDETQKTAAETFKQKLEANHVYDAPIVTKLVPFTNFYPAEQYHQDYYANNPDKPYCQLVINPKLAKFRQRFANLRKP